MKKRFVHFTPPERFLLVPPDYIPSAGSKLHHTAIGCGTVIHTWRDGLDKARIRFPKLGDKDFLVHIARPWLFAPAEELVSGGWLSERRAKVAGASGESIHTVVGMAEDFFDRHYDESAAGEFEELVALLMQHARGDANWLKRRLDMVLERGIVVPSRDAVAYFGGAQRFVLVHEKLPDLQRAITGAIAHYPNHGPVGKG